jgi:hypothetical protein
MSYTTPTLTNRFSGDQPTKISLTQRLARHLRTAALTAALFATGAALPGEGRTTATTENTYMLPTVHATAPTRESLHAYYVEQALEGKYTTWAVAEQEPVVTSLRGLRDPPPGGSRDHPGLDMRGRAGDSVRAVTPAVVVERARDRFVLRTISDTTGTMGDSTFTFYHASLKRGLAPGDTVAAGEMVGRINRRAAAHLHEEVRDEYGIRLDPLCTYRNREQIALKPGISGLRYREGSTVQEKLENPCIAQAAAYADRRMGSAPVAPSVAVSYTPRTTATRAPHRRSTTRHYTPRAPPRVLEDVRYRTATMRAPDVRVELPAVPAPGIHYRF